MFEILFYYLEVDIFRKYYSWKLWQKLWLNYFLIFKPTKGKLPTLNYFLDIVKKSVFGIIIFSSDTNFTNLCWPKVMQSVSKKLLRG